MYVRCRSRQVPSVTTERLGLFITYVPTYFLGTQREGALLASCVPKTLPPILVALLPCHHVPPCTLHWYPYNLRGTLVPKSYNRAPWPRARMFSDSSSYM